jgi:pimeloyl-ACP methyl ester carboxylesterase
MTLADEAALVEPLLLSALEGVHLVGHSYGDAIALKLAAKHPTRVRSVAVYEPVLFRLLFDYNARHAPAQNVRAVADSMRRHLANDQLEASTQRFVDFWSGAGAWQALPEARRAALAARMPSVMGHFDALFHDTLTRAQVARLGVPVLVMRGARTVPAARRIFELLRLALPSARYEVLLEMGHMGPVTHGAQVNRRIAEFLHARVPLAAARAPLAACA